MQNNITGPLDHEGAVCGILLTRGHIAIVDPPDYAELNRYRWCCSETRHKVYAVRVGMGPSGVLQRIYMHRQVLGITGPGVINFRNGDSLDYRRNNLRPATPTGLRQTGVSRHGRSRFKGVSWHGLAGRWQVHIKANGSKHYLGLYDDELMAAKVYDQKAVELHGEFARLNFPVVEA
jgi:hypothetical protein